MKKRFLLFTMLIPFTLSGIAQENTVKYFDKYSNKEMVFTENPQEIIFKFSESSENRKKIANKFNATELINNSTLNIAIYNLSNVNQTSDFIAAMKSISKIEEVSPSLLTREGKKRFYIPGHITVKFNSNVPELVSQKIISSINCTLVTDQFIPGYFTLKVPKNQNIFQTINKLNAFKEVEIAELDYLAINAMDYIPNDALFGQQWALRNTRQYGGVVNADIFVEEAWNITKGNPNVILCLIDEGIELQHPDLWQNYFQNTGEDSDGDGKTLETGGVYDNGDFNGIDDDNNGATDDLVGYNFEGNNFDIQGGAHGTNCAGILSAVMNNSIGVAGIAPDSKILTIKVNLSSGLESSFANAIYYAKTFVEDGKQLVISCSWHISDANSAIQNAIKVARIAGIPVFFASGNYRYNYVNYPGRYPEAISVGGTNMCDTRWANGDCGYSSNYYSSQYGTDLDISAPAQQVYTTDMTGGAGYVPGDYDDTFTGTSASTPEAAATAALIFAVDPNLDPWQIQEILQKSADKVGGYNYSYDSQKPGHSLELGYGRINAFRAVLSRIFRTEIESNNSYTTADGPIVSRMNMAGNISSSGENDWYYFDVTQSGSINISIFGKYKEWFLYSNPQNNYINFSSVGYEDAVNTKSCSLPSAGRYYLKVTSTFTGNYDFCITGSLLSGALFESEQNNSPAWYDGLINPGQLVSAKIDPSSDADWFIFEATATGTITVNSTTANKTWSLYRNPSQAALKTATGTSTYNITSTGKYYLKFTGTAGSYDFKVTGNLATGLVESEMNNEYLAADGPLGNGQRIAGNLETTSDVDWFYLDVLQTGTLTLKLDGDYKSMYLYSNPTGSYLTQLSVGSQTSATTTYNATQTGRYYIKINGQANSYYLSVSGNIGNKSAESAITDEPVTNNTQNTGTVLWSRNYPNPFVSEMTIDFETKEDAVVSIKVYDFKGQEIMRLMDQQNLMAGIHSVIWDGRTRGGMNAENGIYFYTIQCNGSVMHGKMVITR